MILRIQGKAAQVFDAIKNICSRSPYMTLQQAGERGLLPPKLQHTAEYEVGKWPEVDIGAGYERN